MRETNLLKLEDDLQKIPGVRSARVVGTDSPSEIHIVSSGDRSPKQIVRDVQSLAAAGFGIQIDHRIVSVVQLEERTIPDRTISLIESNDAEEREEEDFKTFRPALEHIVLANKREKSWVKVALRWPSGELTEGAGSIGASRGGRARGATVALLKALEPILNAMQAHLDVDEVLIHKVGSHETVSVRTVLHENGSATPLVGSALIKDDVASAAVRAMLHGVNRKLR